MKPHPKLLLRLAVPMLLLLGSPSVRATVTLNIFPASITNDYSGKITLTIAGLTTGQQVQVKRFYDVNTNGTIDPGQDFVIQSFKVTDGQLPIIGGVRNLNVPGDDDGATNGQIQSKLDFPGLSTPSGGTTGNFIFKVEDAQTGASLATQGFSVSQKVYPQGARGRITAAAGGLPVANTPVVLLNPNSDGGVVIAVTDTNGNYNFYSPTGSYAVLVAQSGFVCDENAGFVTILTNQFVTNNLSLASGTFTLSGHLTDAATGKSNGVVFVNAQSTNNLFSGAFTDTNGNFSLPVTSSQWKLQLDEGALAQRGYLSPQNKLTVSVTNSSVSNLNFALSKATALIYGTVKDSLNNTISGISLTADDSGNLYESVAMSETNGAYTLAVVGGNWNASPDSSAVLARGFSGVSGTNLSLTDGTATEADFVLQSATAHLRGQVKDDHGNAITNIQIVVQPYPVQGNGANSIYPTTDGTGNFDVGISGGAWNIALECVSAQQRGYVNVSGFNFNVTDGVDQNGIQLMFPQATAVISGKLTDLLGHPIAGVTLNANQQINTTNSYFPGCVSTDASGNYQIGVLGGTWNVSLDDGELGALGYADVPSTNVTIVAGAATANFIALVSLAAPQFAGQSFSTVTGVSLTLNGDIGLTNTVQFSSNLVNWFTLTNAVLSNATWHIVDPAATNQNHRFYRAVVAP
jgi:hypothetical protein